MRVRPVVALAAATALVLAPAGCGDREAGDRADPDVAAAVAAGRAFLDRYMDPDGRVVRRDQRGDTVSEGQAYGMLVALAIGDRDRFTLVWRWTREHLARPDGLLSWHWTGGRVVDTNSAADADLDAARALVLAGQRYDDPALRDAGAALGRAILDHETVTTGAGRLLTAGTWATTPPYVINPSYQSLRAVDLLRAGADRETARGVLQQAERLDREHPTYYGAAWLALGRIMLTTSLLGGC